MNDATKLRIRRELAERMGYFVTAGNGAFWLCLPSGESVGGGGWATEEDTWDDAPDPFTSHEDAAALVEWLAEQTRDVQRRFIVYLREIYLWGPNSDEQADVPYEFQLLTSPLETRVLAACKALDISTGDE